MYQKVDAKNNNGSQPSYHLPQDVLAIKKS